MACAHTGRHGWARTHTHARADARTHARTPACRHTRAQSYAPSNAHTRTHGRAPTTCTQVDSQQRKIHQGRPVLQRSFSSSLWSVGEAAHTPRPNYRRVRRWTLHDARYDYRLRRKCCTVERRTLHASAKRADRSDREDRCMHMMQASPTGRKPMTALRHPHSVSFAMSNSFSLSTSRIRQA